MDLSLNESYAGVNYIGGYKLNQHLFLGIGTGVDFGLGSPVSVVYSTGNDYACGSSEHNHSYYAEIGSLPISVPLYVDFRVNLSKKKWSTFVGASVGYRFSSTEVNFNEYNINKEVKVNGSCPILSVAFGVNRAINDRCALFLSIGVERTIEYRAYELSTSCNSVNEYVNEFSISDTEYWQAPTLSFGVSF